MKPNGRWFFKAAERSGRHGVAHETGYASRSVIVALAWAWNCNFPMGLRFMGLRIKDFCNFVDCCQLL